MSSPEEKPPAEERAAERPEDGALADPAFETQQLRAFATRVLSLKEGETPSHEAIQQGLTALVKLYALSRLPGKSRSPFAEDRPMPPTAAVMMAGDMLRAVNVELFELAMWQAWSGG